MRIPAALVVAASAIAVVALTVPVANAAAVPQVQITRAQYDSPGADTRSAASLNAEYIQLTNTTKAPISLKGWTLRDNAAHVYSFGAFTLPARTRIIVHTGPGTSTALHRYWQSRAYIWNNDRDTATLRNAAGRPVDSCVWVRPGNGFSLC
ncbi:lamin tail domain-containing protein [Actinoplanes sp. NPDC051470]|uniref:lamin tail domain-containing protein n=1 Tax=Actinoplanes sp. NPDC051470 TaxID=3157224 RepID=UPI003446F3D9